MPIPQLCMNIQGELELADPEILLSYQGWNLLDYPAKLDNFRLIDNSTSFEIDIDDNDSNKLYSRNAIQVLDFYDDMSSITVNDLVRWLDKKIRLSDISQPTMVKFLGLMVNDLLAQYKLTELFQNRFMLANTIQHKINEYRKMALVDCYQASLFDDNDSVQICLDNRYQFEFNPAFFSPQPPFYQGRHKFNKHYFANIEDLKNQGEEFECAVAIDSLNEVAYWVRNPVHRGFGLPLAFGNFYPDFVAELTDGRILVVEYKGEDRVSNDDSKHKKAIGEQWEKLSGGKCLFVMAVKKDEVGRDVRGQLLAKIS